MVNTNRKTVGSRSLADRCRHNFLAQTMASAELLLQAGKVEFVWTRGDHAHIHVPQSIQPKSETYCVDIDWENVRYINELDVCCSCRDFHAGECCEHLWAALVELDQQHIHERVPGSRNLDLVADATKDDSNDDDDDDDSDRELWDMLSDPDTAEDSDEPKWVQGLIETTRLAASYSQRIGFAYTGHQLRGDLFYLLSIDKSREWNQPVLLFFERRRKKNGEWGVAKPARIRGASVPNFQDEDDRWLLGQLLSSGDDVESTYGYSYSAKACRGIKVNPAAGEVFWQRLCATGRFGYIAKEDSKSMTLLAWDDAPPWNFQFHVLRDDKKQTFQLSGQLQRGDQLISVDEPVLILQDGLLIMRGLLSRINVRGVSWARSCRAKGNIEVPLDEADGLVPGLCEIPGLPDLKLNGIDWESVKVEPRPRVRIKFPKNNPQLPSDVDFVYDGHPVERSATNSGIIDEPNRRVLLRDWAREEQFLEQLESAGFRPTNSIYEPGSYKLSPRIFPQAVRQLVHWGWQVETEGKVVRNAGEMQLNVKSGIDWFDLEATCDFGGVSVGLPKLLQALKRGDELIVLDDGSHGMLPEDWLKRYGMLIQLAETHGDTFRFGKAQAALLDALLAAQPAAQVDEKFDNIRRHLRSFEGIQAAHPPASFQGQLREYQTEGLGWLHFLREFQLGGCLADDMGLGKTVQVLSLLEDRRQNSAVGDLPRKLSLAVVPKSLIFNWIEEARRFTPLLRILNYTGLERKRALDKASEYDLLLTTYGTLRRDIVAFEKLEFDYAILDEAQAVKNAGSQAAKACRLIRADNRLAMSGTPIENHLGELWSLFEFLNPGMLGRLSAFNSLSGTSGKAEQQATSNRSVLAHALRPFILRRTKQQVLTELPEKTEQTLYCELSDKERKLYNELRDHYRTALDQRIDEVGLQKAKIHVLEALLRLRQAACHPGLLDKSLASEPSTKVETLLEQLAEILDEGHKALVFSQFTSLLALVRKQLDDRGIIYEYLDGKTRDRQQCVTRFQTDPNCPLFLISLKAGGQGLNLTAADYVFILDPWWNPAVEAQAVDRTHRIGQTQPVFAYRLIARETVEEKILELQGTKRQLADAIISEDNSVLGNLTADDLRLLFS